MDTTTTTEVATTETVFYTSTSTEATTTSYAITTMETTRTTALQTTEATTHAQTFYPPTTGMPVKAPEPSNTYIPCETPPPPHQKCPWKSLHALQKGDCPNNKGTDQNTSYNVCSFLKIAQNLKKNPKRFLIFNNRENFFQHLVMTPKGSGLTP